MILPLGASGDEVREALVSTFPGLVRKYRAPMTSEQAAEVDALRRKLLGANDGPLATSAERTASTTSLRDARGRVNAVENGDELVAMARYAGATGDDLMLRAIAAGGLIRRDRIVLDSALRYLDPDKRDKANWETLWDASVDPGPSTRDIAIDALTRLSSTDPGDAA